MRVASLQAVWNGFPVFYHARKQLRQLVSTRAFNWNFKGVTMGYDVHITRKANWFDESGLKIGSDEWKALLQSDPDMRLDGYASAVMVDGSVLRVDSEGLAVWTAYAGNGTNGNMAWFDFRNGNVVVKNPDVRILGKMWQLAQRLSAKVQGEECEVYGPDGTIMD